jgi:hypothetical protein
VVSGAAFDSVGELVECVCAKRQVGSDMLRARWLIAYVAMVLYCLFSVIARKAANGKFTLLVSGSS